MLGLTGWFSTNILGNRDGEVLDEPSSFKTKEESKLSVLDVILRSDLYPELYTNYVHKVNIHYYPPRGDNKEGWDNIDISGGSGTRCRSRSISSAGIRSSPPRSSSTWRCSSTSRSGPG